MATLKRCLPGGIDVSAEVEEKGLDLTQIGEQAYDERLDLKTDIGSDALVSFKISEILATCIFPLSNSWYVVVASVFLMLSIYALPCLQIAKLTHACAVGDLQKIKYLLKEGADLDCCDYDGRTPLHLAAAEGHTAVLQFILRHKQSHGVDLNAKDRWGRTALEVSPFFFVYFLIFILLAVSHWFSVC